MRIPENPSCSSCLDRPPLSSVLPPLSHPLQAQLLFPTARACVSQTKRVLGNILSSHFIKEVGSFVQGHRRKSSSKSNLEVDARLGTAAQPRPRVLFWKISNFTVSVSSPVECISGAELVGGLASWSCHTRHQRLSAFKNRHLFFIALEARSLKSRCWQTCLLLETREKPSPSFWWLQAFLGLW